MKIENYKKQLKELLSKGLTIDEADAVIYGDVSLENVLKQHTKNPLDEAFEVEEAQMSTYDDAEKIMKVVNEIAEKSKNKYKRYN